ncbi:hypothetical protein AGMMS5026_02950 [Endomicrobiia bacterium]|nr:hypothetical protein AGMMS49523_06710 [Endomicrobiia bacterium]GHT13422.1 hypothetical protein AGMMS49571_07120 [Endomicrobiia bacterium]GHT20840.1 hypothetical protein AGMMS49929_08500 [Endomicrobiia bacterium]GHT28091.1 hypothetical protein AGMMS49995_08280 [Endomicrobiia bacterium]GHT29997.1 hypothetical protein AGMMS5026_02950 [Endomicrobiia bacterium]
MAVWHLACLDWKYAETKKVKHGYKTVGTTSEGGEVFEYGGKIRYCPRDYHYDCFNDKCYPKGKSH